MTVPNLRTIIRTTAQNVGVDLTEPEVEAIRNRAKYKRTDADIINAIEAGFEALSYRERQRPL